MSKEDWQMFIRVSTTLTFVGLVAAIQMYYMTH